MSNNNSFFDNLEEKTNIKQEDLFQIANSVGQSDLQDEDTIRQLISQVSQIANVSVSKEKEDKIVETIINNNMPLDFATLAKMFDKK
ncbi:stage VI sporulation protein F [Bacillus sp. FJAT-45350]|uniref:stage VI sporulation protein F n=1 Tax=Bacillus sp. FJAT-45350 TaxID=2011014 RepID=UPI000BB6EB93|nr:stage VI sporulation protein F [Bacillus sp. FJAT-45350]